MPGFVNPDETESRQSLYRDLLSHLNETIWGSPSTLPRSESGQYTLDFNPVEAFDKTKNPEGLIYAEPDINWIESAVGNKGPGWQSRTLDWLAGRLGKAPKQATVESWLSKAKGAGLPTEERDLLTKALSEMSGYSSKDRIGADAVGFMAEKAGLPTQGIEAKILSEDAARRYTNAHDALEIYTHKIHDKIERTVHSDRFAQSQSKQDTFENLSQLERKIRLKQADIYKLIHENSPRWSQYNLDEVTSPREILYKAKGSTYKNQDIETHYGNLGEGLQWHQREGKLRFPEGESTHLTEQQSDLASEWAKAQKTNGPDLTGRYIYDETGRRQQVTQDMLRTINTIDGPRTGYTNHRGNFVIVNDPIYNAPKPTLHENWYKTGFRDLVNRAVKEDSKFISWDSAAVQKKRWPAGEGTDKFFDQHYDQKLVNFVKKEYGVTPEKVELGKPRGIKDYQTGQAVPKDELKIVEGIAGDSRNYSITNKNESEIFNVFNSKQQAEDFIEYMYKNIDPKDSKVVWRIPVTDEIRRKVLLEGQYFSKNEEANRPYYG